MVENKTFIFHHLFYRFDLNSALKSHNFFKATSVKIHPFQIKYKYNPLKLIKSSNEKNLVVLKKNESVTILNSNLQMARMYCWGKGNFFKNK